MRRAFHIGIFIGTLIGMSACAAIEPADTARIGAYDAAEAGRAG